MKTIIGILIILSTLSCATIIKGSKENVYFNSNPSNSSVFIDGNYVGQTPFYTKLKSNNKFYTIDVVSDSTHFQRIIIKRRINGGYLAADILMSSTIYLLPFIIVDAITGAWYKLDNTSINVNLK